MTCTLMGRNSILLSVALKERRDLVSGMQDCLSWSGVDEDECSSPKSINCALRRSCVTYKVLCVPAGS